MFPRFSINDLPSAHRIIYGGDEVGDWAVDECVFVFPDGREFRWVGAVWCAHGHPMATRVDGVAEAFCPDCLEWYRDYEVEDEEWHVGE
jgi:hypothetical protein